MDSDLFCYLCFRYKTSTLRKKNQFSRQQLGDLCGVAASTIVNYERGTRIPYADTALRMAQVFGMTVEELLSLQNPELEMGKAKAVDDMGRLYGKRSADSAQAYLDGTNALLAGGTLSVEDQLDFISVMRKVLVDAEFRAKQRNTPNKFRTPEWHERNDAMKAEVDRIMSDSEQPAGDDE